MTATTPTTRPDQIELPDIFSKAICLSVELGSLGSKRKVNTSQVSVDAEASLIHVSKTLLESPELLAIKQLQATVRQYLYGRTLRTEIFRSGMYVLPLTLVDETDAQLVDYQRQLGELVEAFLLKYDTLKARDEERLRAVFNPRDYPPPSKIRDACYIAWSYLKFGTPEELLPDSIRAREVAKDCERVAEAAEQFQQLLRAEMLDLVAHMADRLDSTKDGKPKIFRDTLVSNVKEFLALFEARNLTNDVELDRLCRQARGLLDGIDPKTLRDQEPVRESVRKGFAEIKAALDTMVVDRPRRLISMEEEGQ